MKLALALTFLLAQMPMMAQPVTDGALRFGTLGDFPLESGAIIRDCRIGYRTYGELAADRSNVVVLTTWFAGNSGGLTSSIGRGKLFDSSRYFVVVIDALGDSISSSPSNSALQPGAKFPRFTIRDMVRSQHELLTRELKLDRVYAVGGLSMGGMQALQWLVSYPDFMQKVISIVGTPKQTSHDLMVWKTELNILDTLGDLPGAARPAMNAVADVQDLELRTPSYIVEHTPPAEVEKAMEEHRAALGRLNPYDYASQLRAMIDHDIYRDFGGSPEAAARAIHAQLFIAVSLQDHLVQPGPARELARITKADVMTMTSNCGHLATGCEAEVLRQEVERFLAK